MIWDIYFGVDSPSSLLFQIQALERNPGQEELIFQDLVQFASQQGILLPFGRPGRQSLLEQSSDLPLNTVVIEGEQATDLLWEGIRTKVQRGIWTILANIPLSSDQNSNVLCYDRRKISLLNDLCLLYTEEEVWEGYKNYRRKQLDSFVVCDGSLKEIETEFPLPQNGDVPVEVVKFSKLCRAVEIMLAEDVVILQEGVFPETVPNLMFMQETYLKKLLRELQWACQSCISTPNSTERRFSSGFLDKTPGIRRGSDISIGHRGIKEINLVGCKHCFLALVGLETVVQSVLNHWLEPQGTGE